VRRPSQWLRSWEGPVESEAYEQKWATLSEEDTGVLLTHIITTDTLIVSLSGCCSRWSHHLPSNQANYDTMCVLHRVMI
jgi:hypothetical protein